MLGIIILAAGQGKRMNSSLPKVMHKVAGEMMISHIISEVKILDPQQILIVASYDLIEQYVNKEVECVLQDQPLGTAHAVLCGLSKLNENIDKVLILCGDTPLIQKESLKNLMEQDGPLSVMGMHLPLDEQQKPYGRFVIQDNHLMRIAEMKDASEEEKLITLANAGIYYGDKKLFQEYLPLVSRNNQSQEYYLTDIVQILNQKGINIKHSICPFEDTIGVNTRIDLAKAENIMQERLRHKHMQNGATLMDPKSVYFQKNTRIGKDVTIYPNVIFGKDVRIDDDVTIYDHCHIEDSYLMKSSKVGPFAHIRGSSILMEKAEIGNFVELKKTILKQGAKAKHLAYLGDATIGEKANIGAGTITCNYDGFQKHQTIIGDGAFIGSNTALIAPVTIEAGAIVGAGSTISSDVSKDALSFTRPEQIEKEGWAKKFRDKNKKK